MATGRLWDTRYAWQETGCGAASRAAGGPVEAALADHRPVRA